MILKPDGSPVDRKDCTVEVGYVHVTGKAFTQSYVDWNLKEFQRRLITILKQNGGQMHYQEFLREYRRRYPNG